MKWYNTFKRSNGNYVTQEWSAQEMFNYDIFKFCLIAIVGSFLAVLSSGVCLIARLYDYEEDEKAPSFFGIFFALYLMIDYSQGWVVTFILRIFEDEPTLSLMIRCNLAILITHILLLIFGDTIFFNNKVGERKTTLFLYTVFSLIISYFISLTII